MEQSRIDFFMRPDELDLAPRSLTVPQGYIDDLKIYLEFIVAARLVYLDHLNTVRAVASQLGC